MNDKKQRHPILESAVYLGLWTVFALITGAVGGVLGGAFSWCIKAVTGLRTGRPWVVCLLPLAGLIIVFLYKITGEEKNIRIAFGHNSDTLILIVKVLFVI